MQQLGQSSIPCLLGELTVSPVVHKDNVNVILLTIVEECTVVSECNNHVDHADALGELVETAELYTDVCE